MVERQRGKLAAVVAATCVATGLGGATASVAAAAKPVVLARGSLGALGARSGTAYAVVEPTESTLAMVRSNGKSATKAKRFGGSRGEYPDIANGPDGLVVTWGGRATGGEVWFAAPADRLGSDRTLGLWTAPAKVAVAGSQWLLAGSDYKGDLMVLSTTARAKDFSATAITSSGPLQRHLPLDVATVGGAPVVLDLVQSTAGTVIQVVGAGAPTRPIVSARGVEALEGSIAVSGNRFLVAYQRKGRAYLATADASPTARWSVRKLGGPGKGLGGASVVAGGEVLYAQKGKGGQDLYLFDGKRSRRLSKTSDGEEEPMLASDGKRLFAAWTARGRHTDAVLQRIR